MQMSQIHPIDLLVFVLPIVITAASLAAAHWFPWNNGTARPDRITAYTVGVTLLLGWPVLTMLIVSGLGAGYREPFWAALLAANSIVGGATVRFAYWVDAQRAVDAEAVYANQRD